MHYMLLFYADENYIERMTPEEMNATIERHVRYYFDVMERHAVEVGGMERTHTARTVWPENGGMVVRDGPFGQAELALTGFYIIDVDSMEEAIELAKQYQMPEGLGCIEVRPGLRSWKYAPSVETTAEPADVWRRYRDVATWPRWKAGIEKVELDGEFAAGAAGWLTPIAREPLPFRIVEARENEGYVSETDLADDITLRMETSLTPLPDGGTRITHYAVIPRAALYVYGDDFSPEFNAGMWTSLKALAALVESGQDGAAPHAAGEGAGQWSSPWS